MTVQLHQFDIDWDLPNPSPFCLKLETWLRLAGIAYSTVPWAPGASPNGKAPFVVVDGETIADSSTIVRELTQRFGIELDAQLSELQRAQSVLIRRTLEEHTYFALIRDRWLDDRMWVDYRQIIGQTMPALVRAPVSAYLRRKVRSMIHAQGLGRLPQDEVWSRAIEDVNAVLAILGDTPYVFGDEPSSVDAVVYAFFALLAHPIGRGRLSDHCRNQPTLTAYVERMAARVWAD